jgi:F420-dependent oxidoreductase-like protein
MARYGLQLPDFGWIASKPAKESLPRLRDLVQVGEAAGFSSFWVMDHFFQLPPLGGPTAPILEAYTTLGAIAACTAQAELGAMITGVTYRNPALVAKQVTTLDVLSGGRAILGIGAAWYEVEHGALGFAFPKISERFERLEEAVQICRRMFTEPAPKFEGRFYSVREAHNVPPPVRPGGPPIMIGGSGEKKTLRLVAKYGDACNIVGSPQTVVRLLGVLDRHCRELGRDPKEIRRTRLGSLFLFETEAQAESLRRMLAGSGDPNRPGAIEQFTIGTPDRVLDEVRALVRTGLDDVIFNLPGLRDPVQLTRVAVLLREACA